MGVVGVRFGFLVEWKGNKKEEKQRYHRICSAFSIHFGVYTCLLLSTHLVPLLIGAVSAADLNLVMGGWMLVAHVS